MSVSKHGLSKHESHWQRLGSGLPPLRRVVVAVAMLDPVMGFAPRFFFPEGRKGLEIIHQEFARLERGMTVLRGHRLQHDAIAGFETPYPVNHGDAGQGPARSR